VNTVNAGHRQEPVKGSLDCIKFGLVINISSAKVLGLEIPARLLTLTGEVNE
jgi:hypothetical protein